MCCGDNRRLRTCVFSEVGSEKFCVLRSYKDENLFLHVG